MGEGAREGHCSRVLRSSPRCGMAVVPPPTAAPQSTLVAVLTHGTDGRPLLDNGRGLARINVFRHKHEMQSGRTSSICHQLLGYDAEGRVINYATPAATGGCGHMGGSSAGVSLAPTRSAFMRVHGDRQRAAGRAGHRHTPLHRCNGAFRHAPEV